MTKNFIYQFIEYPSEVEPYRSQNIYGTYKINLDKEEIKTERDKYLKLCQNGMAEYPFECFIEYLIERGYKVEKIKQEHINIYY